VGKKYQNDKLDTSQPAVPEQVTVALAELSVRFVRVCWPSRSAPGWEVMTAMMEADVTAACGIKGRHDLQRTATRHGHEAGWR
jgi:putative transposase